MPSITTVVAQALHTAATILRRDAPQDGMVFRELWELVLARKPRLEADWLQAVDESGQENNTPFKDYVNRNATNLVKAGWLYRGARRWQLTGIGVDALARWPDPVDFYLDACRRYRRWERQQQFVSVAMTALEQLPDGGHWVALEELAAEFTVDPDVLGPVLRGARTPGWYLALGEDGQAGAGLPMWPFERDQWRTLLDEEGLLDQGRSSLDTVRALPDRRMPVWEALKAAKQPLEETEADEDAPRQLWIVRGVDTATGVPLVRGPWRDDSKVTLDTGFPPPTAAAHNLDGVRRAVETALPATGPARREAVARELDAFLNRMRKGDIVLSTDGFETYVGVVGGPAVHTAERLERPVDWRNLNKPLDFLKDLPSGLASVVQDADSQVLEATEYAETVLALIGDMPRTAPLPTGPAVLPDATPELAEALHMPDTTWLQDCVELLRATPQLIFHGPPGTGKTFTALALARHLAGASSATNVRLVQFHPAYAYEDFFEGIRPRLGAGQDGETGGGLAYDLVRGPLRKLADEAERRPAEVFVLVVDEINRGHLAKIFGELYFLLEYRNERVHLLYGSDDGRGFRLPPNLYILGTMNTVDRSVAYMDAAMRRRFSFMELHPDTPPVGGLLDSWLRRRAEEQGEDPDAYDDSHARLLDEINRLLADGSPGDRSFRVGPSYFMQDLAHTGDGALERLWKTQIIPLLTEHHWGDGTDVEAVYGLHVLRARLNIPSPADVGSADSADDSADDPANQ
ncbi:GTPase subunit of restriction endonuclease [Streptomyces werraensis]|nr:GTPase subunit of restriction endonuclease [Streptomyces werraensis]